MNTQRLVIFATTLASAACPLFGQYTGDPDLDPRVAQTMSPSEPPPGECEVKTPQLGLRDPNPPTLWPGGVVPFVIDSSVTNTVTTTTAMDVWMFRVLSLSPNVTFVERDPADPAHNNYLFVRGVSGSVSSSYVGVCSGCRDADGGDPVIGSGQIVRQGETAGVHTMAHEFCHALGWDHEHTRPDRDQYVFINTAFVPQEYIHNFNLRAAGNWPTDANLTPYDFASIMHYTPNAFVETSCGTLHCSVLPCCSIVAQSPYFDYHCLMGQRSDLSNSDVQDVINVYGARPRQLYYVGLGLGCVLPTLSLGTLSYPYCSLTEVPGSGDVRIRGGVTYNVTPGTTFTQPATWKKHGEGPAVISAQ